MAVCGGAPVRAQDAALQQRLNELSGRMETLIEALEVQRKQISTVTRQVDQLREEVNKPQAEAASPEDVRRIADAVREVDRKRLDDYEKIRGELRKLADAVEAFVKHPPVARAAPAEKPKPQIPEKGYEYEVQPGDTLSVIIQAYR